MGKNSRLRAAFTLVEVMVVCGIILISTGLGITRYNDFTQKRLLNQALRQVQDIMSIASAKATAGDSGISCTAFQGYQVAVQTNGTHTLKKCCEATCNAVESTLVSTYYVPTGITVSAPTANTTYLFKKLSQGISANPAANLTVTLRNTALARCVSLTLDVSGVITQGAEVAC